MTTVLRKVASAPAIALAIVALASAGCGANVVKGESAGTGAGGASTSTASTTTGSSTTGTGTQGAGGASGTGGGACTNDGDCAFRASGCCGVCSNETDTLPPPLGCGIDCPTPPSCVCVAGACTAGKLVEGASCETDHDLCGSGLKCCNTCCGTPPPDGGSFNPDPECVLVPGGSQGQCPAIN